MLQAEFAPAQVFDRPMQGRVFFEEAMRENLASAAPTTVQARDRGRVGLRRTRHPTHPLAVPNPRHHRRSHPVPARRLQALAHRQQAA